jgi:hypothetical protein
MKMVKVILPRDLSKKIGKYMYEYHLQKAKEKMSSGDKTDDEMKHQEWEFD